MICMTDDWKFEKTLDTSKELPFLLASVLIFRRLFHSVTMYEKFKDHTLGDCLQKRELHQMYTRPSFIRLSWLKTRGFVFILIGIPPVTLWKNKWCAILIRNQSKQSKTQCMFRNNHGHLRLKYSYIRKYFHNDTYLSAFSVYRLCTVGWLLVYFI